MDAPIASPLPDTLESRRSLLDRLGDFSLRWVSALAAVGVVALIVADHLRGHRRARAALRHFGIGFLWHETWNAVTNQYGALDFIIGARSTSRRLGASCSPGLSAIAIGLYLSELAPAGVRGVVGSLVEMLAAIPSVVLGLWGIIILGPVVHNQFGPG